MVCLKSLQTGRVRRPLNAAVWLALALSSALSLIQSQTASAAVFNRPTYSSPIAMSADNQLVWVVNPEDDSVSVIRTDTYTVIAKITVGDEPQSIAVDPNNQFAYVANTASSNVTVIRINNADPAYFQAEVNNQLTTGAEPWNIVISPDGTRVFVANSGQDTITVIRMDNNTIIGQVELRTSLCNEPDRERHFQPRGLAVTTDNTKLYVTRFLSFTRAGGRQGDDNGKEGAVCRLDINTASVSIADYQPAAVIILAPQATGFKIDKEGDGVAGDGVPDDTAAFPNQLQSIVIRDSLAYLPNIASSPTGPLRFNVDTHAFINIIRDINSPTQTDGGALNLHLGARDPEVIGGVPKKKLFFANPWATAFTTQSSSGTAYAVSAGSDLLVKVNVAADGVFSFTVDDDTTRYIDLNDPVNPATSGLNACKNPLGIVINDAGTLAYVMCRVSRNVAVVNLGTDAVAQVIRTIDLPAPASPQEEVLVGAEMFFSSRGHFDRPVDTTVSTDERLSSEGWQNCASCHFEGLTDGVVWAFGSGPRKSVSLNGSFNPHDPENDQRILNYSAIFDEIEDFELNIRNVSGPGPLADAAACSDPPPDTSTFDPNHGLLIGDNGNINIRPCTINAFAKPNAGRPQHTVTLPGSTNAVPALTALKRWVQLAIRTPNGPLTSNEVQDGVSPDQVIAGRTLFQQAGCTTCHAGGKWTISIKDFTSPPDGAEIFTETNPAPNPAIGNPVAVQYLDRFLQDIRSFNLGVAGGPNLIGNNVGAVEKASSVLNAAGVAQPALDGLGIDYNGDGKGEGFNVPSLLGIHATPPYYHNGTCETLACVVSDVNHRTAGGTLPDVLANPEQQGWVVKFLESIGADTQPF
jgi:40-residue YVTN family beta-propeller repeat